MLTGVEHKDSSNLEFVPILISFYLHPDNIFLIWGYAGLYTGKLLSASCLQSAVLPE